VRRKYENLILEWRIVLGLHELKLKLGVSVFQNGEILLRFSKSERGRERPGM
jgi:hypothetical protein